MQKPPKVEDRLIIGFINPLAFLAVEEPWKGSQNMQPASEEDVLRHLVAPDLDASKDEIISRFLRISTEGSNRIAAAPIGVLQSLILPLRHAKGSYALGNYIGTMALCGMVCEMATIFIFESNDAYHAITRNGKQVREQFKNYFEKDGFAKAGQAERIKALAAMGIITPDIREKLHLVRTVRRRHLHFMPGQGGVAEQDALKCYMPTVEIVIYALGLRMADGKLAVRPEVLAWLGERGLS